MTDTTSVGPVLGFEEIDEAQTVFGRFLLAIKQGQTAQQSFQAGTIIWTDEPLEQIVLSGLWVIMCKVAEMIGERMETTSQAHVIAERVNRLVSAGIILLYKTPEEAGHQFRFRVLEQVRQAHTLGYRPGMQISLQTWQQLALGNKQAFRLSLPQAVRHMHEGSVTAYWQGPATLFMAELVRTSRDLRKRVQDSVEHLRRRNQLVRGECREVVRTDSIDIVVNRAKAVLLYLDEQNLYTFGLPEVLPRIEEELAQAHQVCAVFERFKVNPREWPDQDRVSQEREWTSTQILLAHTQEPSSQDVLTGVSQFHDAFQWVQKSSDEDVFLRTFARFDARVCTPSLNADERAILRNALLRELARIRRWDVAHVSSIMLRSVLVVFSETELLLDAHTALGVALGERPEILGQLKSSEAERRVWIEGVGRAISWAFLSDDEVLAIIEQAVLSPDAILEGIQSCEEDVREKIGKNLLALKDPEPKLFNGLIKGGSLRLTPEFFKKFVRTLDPEVLETHLVEMFEDDAFGDEESLSALWIALGHVSSEWAQAFIDHVSYRHRMCSFGFEIMQSPIFSSDDYTRVRENLGDERYRMLVLGSIAYDREVIREAFCDSEDDLDDQPKVLSSWLNSFSQETKFDVCIPLIVLGKGITPEQAQELLQEIPEEMALAWVHAKK